MRANTLLTRSAITATVVAAGVAFSGVSPRADGGSGKSFTYLQSPFTQDVFGVSSNIEPVEAPSGILGGVAFAPNGDVWSAECNFYGTRLHRFAQSNTYTDPTTGTILHSESIVDLTASGPYGDPQGLFPDGIGGCGLVNHPDGYMYMNSPAGLWWLDPASGKPINPTSHNPIEPDDPTTDGAAPLGMGGNALGIAVDPSSRHIVYVGDDCHPSLLTNADTCTLFDFDPATGNTLVFARLNRNPAAWDPDLGYQDLVDGIYFDPSGQFVFAAYRGFLTSHGLMIIRRPGALLSLDVLPSGELGSGDGVNTRFVPMASATTEPDGVAFHATQGFVVTLNESRDSDQCVDSNGQQVPPGTDGTCPAGTTDYGGTMTRFDFAGGDFQFGVVTQTVFASGGFRGDLLQVGADRCIYATQGRLFESGGTSGVRYDDGTVNPEAENLNSIVQICGGGGFEPPPGVESYSPLSPAISIVKTTNGTNNNSAPGPAVLVGSTVTWDYYVTNVGQVPLTNIKVTDNKFSNPICEPYGLTLAPGETVPCTASAPAIAGQYENIGTVTAIGGGASVTASDPDHYFGNTPVYFTFTQGGWGAPPNGNNPGMLLKNNFTMVYTPCPDSPPFPPTCGVTIGGSPHHLQFTRASAIEKFLPAGGKPGVLTSSATNPTSSSAKVFAGQVLALQLSVDFSNAGKTPAGLAALKVSPGHSLAGMTVAEVLALANQVLAGNTSVLAPYGMTVSSLNDLVSNLNQNFDGGTTNNGWLVS